MRMVGRVGTNQAFRHCFKDWVRNLEGCTTVGSLVGYGRSRIWKAIRTPPAISIALMIVLLAIAAKAAWGKEVPPAGKEPAKPRPVATPSGLSGVRKARNSASDRRSGKRRLRGTGEGLAKTMECGRRGGAVPGEDYPGD